MARQSKLVSPSLVSEMKAELQSLAETEPGAKDLAEVVAELMPLGPKQPKLRFTAI